MKVKEQLASFIASGGYSGYSRIAPGTAGSIVGTCIWWLIFSRFLTPTILNQLIIFLTVTIVGTIATSITLKTKIIVENRIKDPQFIVIDEWAGIALSLTFIRSPEPVTIIMAFILFRIFDIFKPGPIAWSEKLPGAYGVMADDLVAGLFTAISLELLVLILP